MVGEEAVSSAALHGCGVLATAWSKGRSVHDEW